MFPRIQACSVALLVASSLTVSAQTNAPALEQSDEGAPEQRIREYLERHGDFGRIDPELMLRRSREMKAALDRDRFMVKSIAGSEWTSIGPTNGAGRATAVAPHPAINGTAIIGAAGGGAWKTTDAGQTWRALTDDIPNLSVGAIAYAPSDPSVVYLGTGEGGYAGDFIPGIGLLVSGDGGESWTLPASVIATQFYKFSVNPSDPKDVLAGTNNGLLRSKGGQNGPWTTVIPAHTVNGGPVYGDVTDIVRDPTDANTIYAATWDRRQWCIHNHCSIEQFLPTPTILKSTDGGDTWAPAATGIPVSTDTQRVNRLSIAIAPSSPSTLYAATSTLDGGAKSEVSHVYKSTDGGGSWSETNLHSTPAPLNAYLGTQAWYDNVIVVSPADPNIVTVGGVTYARSTDGGATWGRAMSNVHVDAHDFRYDNFGTMWIANDGGVYTSADNGGGAIAHNTGLVTRQFYAIANDPANRNRVYGGQQDNGTIVRGDAGGTSWTTFSGGDGFACVVHPALPSIAYSTVQNGIVLRTVSAGSLNRIVERTPPYDSGEITPFYSIIAVDPRQPSTLYTVSSRVWKSTTGGEGWTPLGIALPNGLQIPANASIRTMAIAPSDPHVIMIALASPARRVFRTTDGGTQWNESFGLPPGRTILHLEIDPHDPQHVFATIAGTTGTPVFMSTDGGATWLPRSTGLPPFSAQTVRFDPTDTNTLYAGTDVGVYRSIDGGAAWSRFGSGMPAVSVYDVEPLLDGTILRVATHGRGVWELTIPNPPNTAPAVSIISPLTRSITVPRFTKLSFTGQVADAENEATQATWTFSDTWETLPAANNVAVKHTFVRPGRYAVGLAATDSRGGIGAATVEVTVADPSDACGTALDVSPRGDFPYSVAIDTDIATKEISDPRALPSCYPFGTVSSSWLTFTAPETGQYDFSLFGSEVSAILVGYTGECNALTLLNGVCLTRPNSDADAGSSFTSATLNAGDTVRLLVSNYYSNDYGNVVLTVSRPSLPGLLLVTRVAPAIGSAGTPIVINGAGFQSGATVTVGGAPATNVSFVSARLLTATLGPRGDGDATVVVKNPDGTTATLNAGFTYESGATGPKRRAVKR